MDGSLSEAKEKTQIFIRVGRMSVTGLDNPDISFIIIFIRIATGYR